MFARLLEAMSARRPESLRFVFTAGAAIPVGTIHAYERHGLVLKQGFGHTETSILCCLDARDAVRKAGSVGRPVFHAEVRCVNPETFRDVDPGDTGEIVVRGLITMLGYWNRPDATAEAIVDGWFRSGDVFRWDPDGRITFLERLKDMLKVGGENVAAAEIEACLQKHPGVKLAQVVGIPDPRYVEVPAAFVERKPDVQVGEKELIELCRRDLAGFKVPRHVRFVDEWPMSTSKIQKFRLRDQLIAELKLG